MRAALRRRCLDEAWAETGRHVVGTHWDVEKFYDSVNPRRMGEVALEQGVCPRHLAISLQIHLAPRVLRMDRCCSRVVAVSSSIMAGCQDSNGFARSIMYELLEKAHYKVGPCTTFRQFVDDVAQSNKGDRLEEVAQEMIEAAGAFTEAMGKEGFRISKKSTAICSSRKLKMKVASKLRILGNKTNLTLAEEVKDLGIDAGSARKRLAGHSDQ